MTPRFRPPRLSLGALTRATALVAEGLSEERLLPLLARCAAEASAADLAAIYLRPSSPRRRKPAWHLAGHCGGDPEVLAALPARTARWRVLAPLFQSAHRRLRVGPARRRRRDAPVRRNFPSAVWPAAGASPRSAVHRRPARRRARRSDAFDDDALGVIRAIGQLIGIGIDNARLAAGQQRERRMAAESAVTLGTVLGSVGSGVCVARAGRHACAWPTKLPGPVRPDRRRRSGIAQEEVFATAGDQTRASSTRSWPACAS